MIRTNSTAAIDTAFDGLHRRIIDLEKSLGRAHEMIVDLEFAVRYMNDGQLPLQSSYGLRKAGNKPGPKRQAAQNRF